MRTYIVTVGGKSKSYATYGAACNDARKFAAKGVRATVTLKPFQG